MFAGVLSGSSILTIENKCNQTVWPVIFSWKSNLSTTGFVLRSGETRTLHAPSSWYGLISARTLCSTNSTGYFSCATGDCESGIIECPGTYGWSVVTYVYFRIDLDGVSSYTITVEHGYNLPLVVVPSQPSHTCISAGCLVDLNKTCPEDLGLFMGRKQIGCISACNKYETKEICCTNDFRSKQRCERTMYSQNFEQACPHAYSYAFEDHNSTVTCPKSTDFNVTFCPSFIPNNTRSDSLSFAGNFD